MGQRVKLQQILEEILGSKNVYYSGSKGCNQSPENVRMNYPAIRYSKEGIDSKFANNSKYINTKRYQITLIDRRPDNSAIDKILNLPLSSYDRHFISDNLHHDVITIYY